MQNIKSLRHVGTSKACCLQAVGQAALDILRTQLQLQPAHDRDKAYRDALALLQVLSHTSPAVNIPHILDAIIDLLIQCPAIQAHGPHTSETGSLPALDMLGPGEPLLGIIKTSPSLEDDLKGPLTSLLASLANHSLASSHAKALFTHVRSFLVAALLSSGPLSPHAVNDLLRLSERRADLRWPILRTFVLCLELSRCFTKRCLPGGLSALAQALNFILSDCASDCCNASEANAEGHKRIACMTTSASHALLMLMLHFHDLDMQVAPAAWALTGIIQKKTLGPHASRLAAALVQCAAACPFSVMEEMLLLFLQQLMVSCDGAWSLPQELSSLRLLTPQLLDHRAHALRKGIAALSEELLGHVSKATIENNEVLLPRLAHAGGWVVAGQPNTTSEQSEACIAWLRQVMAGALAALCGLRKQRGVALTRALLLGQTGFSVLHDAIAANAAGLEETSMSKDSNLEFLVKHGEVALMATFTEAEDELTRHAAMAALVAVALAAPSSVVPLATWALCRDTCCAFHPMHQLTRWLVLFPVMHTSPAVEQAFFGHVAKVMDVQAPAELGAVLGLRLLSAYWQVTGRGWNQLCSAILTQAQEPAAKSKHPPVAMEHLRICVATTICAVAHVAPEKCLQVVSALGQCVSDIDRVAALALEALAALCAAVRSHNSCFALGT
jgi:hypothetical protein